MSVPARCRSRLLRAAGTALALAALSLFAQSDPTAGNIVQNGGAEHLTDGMPDEWGFYHGKGDGRAQASETAHSGSYSACMQATAMGTWKDRPYINIGLMLGNSDGYNGADAYAVEPGEVYELRFWMRGTVPRVNVLAVCWSGSARAADRRSVSVFGGRVNAAEDWEAFSGYVSVPSRCTRLALKWQVAGFADDGYRPGELYVDDVFLQRVGSGAAPRVPRRIRIPEHPNAVILGHSLDSLCDAVNAGDPELAAAVRERLNRAAVWAEKSDDWYLERTMRDTPLGMWTLACPFHPERVRDFSADNFHWSIDDPWSLTCPLCKTEGRTLFSYPNERYPDDGTGCSPSDEVWAEDHDAAWSREHSGIPHSRWDGKPHGYSAAGYCYFFKGKCAHLIMTFMAQETLPELAEGYVLRRAFPEFGGAPAELMARRVKVALLALSRAHLGDAYLADLLNMPLSEFDDVIAAFHQETQGERFRDRFPGYTPYDLQDGVRGNPEHPARRTADIYGDGSFRGDAYAKGWLRAYVLVRDSFTPAEEPVRSMIERLLVSGEHDADALADTETDEACAVKPGKLDLALEPYSMNVGASNNLGGRELANQFELGVLLADPQIVDAVVSNVWYYVRNYFNGDGLGRETSPAYTNCAWTSMWSIFPQLYGYRGHYDASHPWWDADLDGLNPYSDPALRQAASKAVFCLFPDDTAIPWMDSHAGVSIQRRYLNLVASVGGGLPPEVAPCYSVDRSPEGGMTVTPHGQRLPSMLLHESCKAVLRSGAGDDMALLSVDYAPNTGHWHPAPMDLVLYAEGHELASDLGYFGAMHWLTKEWIRTCPAHNTCIVRDETGNHAFMHSVQGELRTVFASDADVGAVEIVERDPEHLQQIPGAEPVFQRTSVLLRFPGEPDRHCVVDLFRVRGGATHDFMFHSMGRVCTIASPQMELLPEDLTFYEASGFTTESERTAGCGRIAAMRRGRTDGPVTVEWRQVADFRTTPPVVDNDAGLRLTALGGTDTTVLLGQAPGQRRMSNVDQDEPLHVLCLRRANRQNVDAFVSLIEPLRGDSVIRAFDRLPVTEGPPDTIAVAVTSGPTTVCVVSIRNPARNGDEHATVQLGDGRTLRTDGDLTVLTLTEGRPTDLRLYGGTRAQAGSLDLVQRPAYEGKLVEFDPAACSLDIETAGEPLPAGNALAGETVVVEHDIGTTTYTVERVEHTDGSRTRIVLARTPHLMENLLRVTRVTGPVLGIEPPPSLPARFERMGYCIYSDASPYPQKLGRITGRQGKTITLDRAPAGLTAGARIGVTRLDASRDRVYILPHAHTRALATQ